jgi:hypothetical protein
MISIFLFLLLSLSRYTSAFTVTKSSLHNTATITSANTSTKPFAHQASCAKNQKFVLYAGGFEWEDPAEAFDQGVDNPYKNPELNLLKDSSSVIEDEGGELKIDPARLLGPRLNGSNLYFVGMMGSGKSAVGDIVARRK